MRKENLYDEHDELVSNTVGLMVIKARGTNKAEKGQSPAGCAGSDGQGQVDI